MFWGLKSGHHDSAKCFCTHGARNLLAVRVALGVQAMKKADAEEAPAMKSMKAMKAGQGSRDGRRRKICSKRYMCACADNAGDKTISVIAGARILHLLHYLLLVPMTL